MKNKMKIMCLHKQKQYSLSEDRHWWPNDRRCVSLREKEREKQRKKKRERGRRTVRWVRHNPGMETGDTSVQVRHVKEDTSWHLMPGENKSRYMPFIVSKYCQSLNIASPCNKFISWSHLLPFCQANDTNGAKVLRVQARHALQCHFIMCSSFTERLVLATNRITAQLCRNIIVFTARAHNIAHGTPNSIARTRTHTQNNNTHKTHRITKNTQMVNVRKLNSLKITHTHTDILHT